MGGEAVIRIIALIICAGICILVITMCKRSSWADRKINALFEMPNSNGLEDTINDSIRSDGTTEN